MEPNEWLLDADAAVALVRRVIDDIDEGGEDAWGSLWAQNQ
jgi:hypothetical protein